MGTILQLKRHLQESPHGIDRHNTITVLLILNCTKKIPMSYRCLLCEKVMNSAHKLELHLQTEHLWGSKRRNKSKEIDTWT